MNNYFKISEFIIDPNTKGVPLHVCDKIVQYHLPILNSVRESLGEPVYISQNSGYRSISWERERGRSGNSQHTFQGNGAVDIRANNMNRLLLLILKSKYNRVCYYPHHGFIHCDFKGDKFQYFEADINKKWHYIESRTIAK